MSDTTPEPEARTYEVSIVAFPEATSPLEAYLMTVDTLIREGADNFHPIIIDNETGERWMFTPEKTLVTGEAMAEAVRKLREQMDEISGAAD